MIVVLNWLVVVIEVMRNEIVEGLGCVVQVMVQVLMWLLLGGKG